MVPIDHSTSVAADSEVVTVLRSMVYCSYQVRPLRWGAEHALSGTFFVPAGITDPGDQPAPGL